ncbi:hypothetical protein [Aeromonas sp. MrichA-1]|uniref:hypothetical protein n=1 Tax=Aeromonas sp. MrichA-1 TaxID=2823362 RepID=UPI001B31EAA9|nr:hypothetical protein [Aeromonas sp. MrichA-1]MBP4081789.1 hypothetical protein [Aeromonas sp. MrichA-1]
MTKTENLIFDTSVGLSNARDIFSSLQKRICITTWCMLIPVITLYFCFFTDNTLGVAAQKAIIASSAVFIAFCAAWIYSLTKTISELSTVMFFLNRGMESFKAKKDEKEKRENKKALKKRKKENELTKKAADSNAVNLEKEEQK